MIYGRHLVSLNRDVTDFSGADLHYSSCQGIAMLIGLGTSQSEHHAKGSKGAISTGYIGTTIALHPCWDWKAASLICCVYIFFEITKVQVPDPLLRAPGDLTQGRLGKASSLDGVRTNGHFVRFSPG